MKAEKRSETKVWKKDVVGRYVMVAPVKQELRTKPHDIEQIPGSSSGS